MFNQTSFSHKNQWGNHHFYPFLGNKSQFSQPPSGFVFPKAGRRPRRDDAAPAALAETRGSAWGTTGTAESEAVEYGYQGRRGSCISAVKFCEAVPADIGFFVSRIVVYQNLQRLDFAWFWHLKASESKAYSENKILKMGDGEGNEPFDSGTPSHLDYSH